MSPSMRLADNRRTTARVVLFIVVSVMTTLVLFAGGPIGSISFAQQQTTQPPNSPPCNGGNIEWVNPSGDATGPGSEMSTKEESAGQSNGTAEAGYHLVAWMSGTPDNAVVEFRYQDGDDPEVTITANAERVGQDTWEYYWDLANVPESLLAPDSQTQSTITMKAILLAGTGTPPVECDRDEEQAVVNNESRDPANPDPTDPRNEDRAETVEITYPANGGQFGFYKGVGFIEVRYSGNATFLKASYTVTAPGQEPTWKDCGFETAADAADGIECALEEGDDPPEVTGVAVESNDTDARFEEPLAQFDDSGDAHRAFGYEQRPSSVAISPFAAQVPPANASGDFACSPVITATVTDQTGRKVAGANVDVHAQGPTDNLFFDDDEASGDNTDDSQPPDKGGHQSESGVDCEDDTQPIAFTSGVQSEHDQAGSTPDIKHIESAAGTNDDGTFTFQLLNRSRNTGTTNVLVFADNDDNDQFCSTEPSAQTAIGWGVAPTPGTVPTGPSACPTATTSVSPSASTTSPGPTPTNTSPSPTPSNTTPPPPVTYSSDVSINHDGNSFNGKVDSAKRCERGRKVIAKKKRPGRDKKIGSDTTNRRGKYSIPARKADGTYYTVALKKITGSDNHVTCLKGRSRNERV